MITQFVQGSYADWLVEVNYYIKAWTGFEIKDIAPLDYHEFRSAGIDAYTTAERAVAGDDHWWGLH